MSRRVARTRAWFAAASVAALGFASVLQSQSATACEPTESSAVVATHTRWIGIGQPLPATIARAGLAPVSHAFLLDTVKRSAFSADETLCSANAPKNNGVMVCTTSTGQGDPAGWWCSAWNNGGGGSVAFCSAQFGAATSYRCSVLQGHSGGSGCSTGVTTGGAGQTTCSTQSSGSGTGNASCSVRPTGNSGSSAECSSGAGGGHCSTSGAGSQEQCSVQAGHGTCTTKGSNNCSTGGSGGNTNCSSYSTGGGTQNWFGGTYTPPDSNGQCQ